jgi:hypothetical protein
MKGNVPVLVAELCGIRDADRRRGQRRNNDLGDRNGKLLGDCGPLHIDSLKCGFVVSHSGRYAGDQATRL